MTDASPRPKIRRRYRIAAVLLIACAILSILIHVLNYWDSAPGLFTASGVIVPSSASLASLSPTPDEWPLIAAKQFEFGRPPERYQLEVRGVRESSLLQLSVTGGSPERTCALAAWLTDSITQSLRRSFESRNFGPSSEAPLVLDRPVHPASPLHFHSVALAFQLLTPCLLLVSGLFLFRASKMQ